MTQQPSPPPPPGLGPPPPPPPPPPARGPSGLAVAALILGLIGLVPWYGAPAALLALIFGGVAIGTKRGQPGLAKLGMICAGIGIFVTLTIGPPWRLRTTGSAKQAMCMANLNAIGKATLLYMSEPANNGGFPLLRSAGPINAPLSPATMHDDVHDPALTNHAMQNVWVMIKDKMVDELAFQCPSDEEYEERKDTAAAAGVPLRKYGWISKKNFSFGIHKPYGNNAGDTGNKAPLTTDKQGGFVIFADKNVGGPVYWNSRHDRNRPSNHPKDGFSCLTYQGSVKFHKTPVDNAQANSKAGVGKDDVYAAGDKRGTVRGGFKAADNPLDNDDTFILPWE